MNRTPLEQLGGVCVNDVEFVAYEVLAALGVNMTIRTPDAATIMSHALDRLSLEIHMLAAAMGEESDFHEATEALADRASLIGKTSRVLAQLRGARSHGAEAAE